MNNTRNVEDIPIARMHLGHLVIINFCMRDTEKL